MRILFLIHEYPPIGGGAGIALDYLAKEVLRQGHEVAILCCGNRSLPEDNTDFRIQRIPVASSHQRLSGIRAWLTFLHRAPKELNTLIQDFKPDVLNAHFAFPAGWVATRAKLNCPLITSIIGADIHDPTRRVSADKNPLIYRAVETTLHHSQAVTADSQDLATRTTALYPTITPEVIHFGVPPLHPTMEVETDLAASEKPFSIVTLSRLVPRKRLDRLIDAVGRLPQHSVQLTILGDGPLRSSLEAQTAALGLQASIQFKGFVTEKDKVIFLQQADLFCLPSEHEGFGLVFLEAMSLGTPVLTTKFGGQTDIIQHKKNGFLLEESSVDAITEQLNHMIQNPSILHNIREQARQRAQLFTPRNTAHGFLRVFESTITAS